MVINDIYIGMHLEVLDENDNLYFVGKIIDMDNDMILITDPAARDVPPVLYDSEIRLRGFTPGMNMIYGNGRICGATADHWRLNRLDFRRTEDLRGSYRQRMSADATVTLANGIFCPERVKADTKCQPIPCRVLDISMSGIRFVCDELLDTGDYVIISGLQITTETEGVPKSFTCHIVRRMENLVGYTYGCELVGLTPHEQERLIRDIFEAQRADLRKRQE